MHFPGVLLTEDTKGGVCLEIEVFCRQENPRLVGMLTLYCGDRVAAEDIAQEALARAWHHWKKVSRMDDPAAWTRRVALNLAKSRFRRLLRERRYQSTLDGQRPHYDVDVTEQRMVREALGALPARQRAAVVLRYYLELSYSEVGQVMDAPPATARSLVHRGLANLRKTDKLQIIEEALDVT